MDDFNDNTKTAWTDFTFMPGFGLPTEAGGQFEFVLPPAGQDIFTASQKVSQELELKEGRTIELRVDLVGASGEDAFAVLGFIPTANSPGTLQGYAIAKDPTDVLITKGVQKYFVADDNDATATLVNENVTLVLSLTARGGNVTVTGRILDKANNNAVIWERTVVDTPAADMMEDGTDDPAAPWITTGYFTLYCYQQFSAASDYIVTYDNAEYYIMDEAVVDDFNDNTKTAWTDFTFMPGFGLPTETDGRFHFVLPPAGQDIFTASQKVSREIAVTEGERVELQVDLVEASGEDAFAVLGFIPTANSPGTLQGYAIAKDPTDVLITKGIQKYFVADDDDATATLVNENVTLVLSLTARNGNVIVTGQILDKSNNNAVIWERTVIDTPAADVMDDGTDDPAAPYITSGYFTLYCYQQFSANADYVVTFDNAVLRAPPAEANVAPLLQDIQPAQFANFLPASTQISFKVVDDADLDPTKVSVWLDGTNYTTANGLTVTGSGTNLTATLGGLAANVNHVATLSAEDAAGATVSRELYFDTFATSSLVVEAEDYNFDAGSYINNPTPTAEGWPDLNSYCYVMGVLDVDYSDTRTSPNWTDTMYRPDDPIRMQHTRDFARAKYTAAGGSEVGVWDYDVGDIAAGEWMNYTRNFASGTYEVYLREALANMQTGESVLEKVTGDRTQPDQTTEVLGSFLGQITGFQYRNFALTDGTGLNKITVRLNGVTTLRLRQVTPDPGDGARFMNYLIFIPVPETGTLRANVSSVTPAPNSTVNTASPVIEAVIQNRDTSVAVNTVKLEVNGQAVSPQVTPTATGATVSYAITPLPASGSSVTAKLSFQDSEAVDVSTEWSFIVTYKSLDPALRVVGVGTNAGFNVRVVQIPMEEPDLANSLQRAEDQLAPNSTIPKYVDTTVVEPVVNFNQDAESGGTAGYFDTDAPIPGIDGSNGTDDIAMEVFAYLDLAAGVYRFGINCDDGYKLQAASSMTDRSGAMIAFHNGGPADETVDVVVSQAGLYILRLVWYERGGGAHVEWLTVNQGTGVRTLVNGSGADAVKAYTSAIITAPPEFGSVTLSGNSLTVTWSGTAELQESPTLLPGSWTPAAQQTSPVTVDVQAAGMKFYRLMR